MGALLARARARVRLVSLSGRTVLVRTDTRPVVGRSVLGRTSRNPEAGAESDEGSVVSVNPGG
jgi:hypothetical protein